MENTKNNKGISYPSYIVLAIFISLTSMVLTFVFGSRAGYYFLASKCKSYIDLSAHEIENIINYRTEFKDALFKRTFIVVVLLAITFSLLIVAFCKIRDRETLVRILFFAFVFSVAALICMIMVRGYAENTFKKIFDTVFYSGNLITLYFISYVLCIANVIGCAIALITTKIGIKKEAFAGEPAKNDTVYSYKYAMTAFFASVASFVTFSVFSARPDYYYLYSKFGATASKNNFPYLSGMTDKALISLEIERLRTYVYKDLYAVMTKCSYIVVALSAVTVLLFFAVLKRVVHQNKKGAQRLSVCAVSSGIITFFVLLVTIVRAESHFRDIHKNVVENVVEAYKIRHVVTIYDFCIIFCILNIAIGIYMIVLSSRKKMTKNYCNYSEPHSPYTNEPVYVQAHTVSFVHGSE